MSANLQAVRGMNDLFPSELATWQFVEKTLLQTVAQYGYQEIRFPIVESTQLFKRSIGEVTDIVEKEMYTFADRNGDSLTLRPEGTAGCVRALIQSGEINTGVQRVWYTGPMFRHERPQKGRYRQFYQFGVEAYGMSVPEIDAEMIALSARCWQRLSIADAVVLEINSLGEPAARQAYREALVSYFEQHHEQLDTDSQRRLHSNPLRILDSKNPDMAAMLADAPSLLDYLDAESAQHFQQVQANLDALGITYRINPRLVRGLDYYNGTVFEWVTDSLGSQGTVCAGGRYDGLVAQLGGNETAAIGFALGMERLVAVYEAINGKAEEPACDVYIVHQGEQSGPHALNLAEQCRQALPTLRVVSHMGGGNFKRQFKKADKSGAQVALVLGDDEIAAQRVSVKFLRHEREQETVDWSALPALLEAII